MIPDQPRAYEAIEALRLLREQEIKLDLLRTRGLIRCSPWFEYIPYRRPRRGGARVNEKESKQ